MSWGFGLLLWKKRGGGEGGFEGLGPGFFEFRPEDSKMRLEG